MRLPWVRFTVRHVIAATSLAGLVAWIYTVENRKNDRQRARVDSAMSGHDPDAAAARELLLCTWLTSHDPLRPKRKDTPEDVARSAAVMWRAAKKLGKRPDVEPIVAGRVRWLRSQGLSREEALARLLGDLPPGYPDEVASDRERLTRLVERWWGPQVDQWWAKETARHRKETRERRAREKAGLERFLASGRAKPHARVAVEFASALVDKDFARAEKLLTPELRRELTGGGLRERFYGTFRGYAKGEPRAISFDEKGQMERWPGKRPGDVGWAYVGIEGDDFVEAVVVVVASVGGRALIREVRWGRP
jgi:hypothetical protein